MKVNQFINSRGNAQANHFTINDGKGKIYFQSYDSIIGFVEGINVTLDKDKYNYSMTTVKHRNHWLNMSTKEIEKQIVTGEIAMENLNA